MPLIYFFCFHFAVYLDEIQDFSYAAIFLICNIAGKDSLRWVVCGDRNQMISMGSSFTFAGLKDTFLAVRDEIDCKLLKEAHLVVNYRTTMDVLLLGNDILAVAKKAFPDAIGFAYPETSKKDLGIKVVLCDWASAFAQAGIRLGRNQALIYSAFDAKAFEKTATDWIGAHPFILSSLDSKGLEFDDVIVAFDLDRKTWMIDEKKIATLRMLRELYVAVTRAQRRVVILIRREVSTMKSFFDVLAYDFLIADADFVRLEFDQETTYEMWREKGHELFDDGQYFMASRCFGSSGDRGWSNYAIGRHLLELGNKPDSVDAYCRAFHEFYRSLEFERTVDVALTLAKIAPECKIDSEKLDIAVRRCPDYVDRVDVIRLALLCGKWDKIFVDDLKEAHLADILMIYRENEDMVRLVAEAADVDRADMEDSIPAIVGDFHKSLGATVEAIRLFIKAQDFMQAEELTRATLASVKRSGLGQTVLTACLDQWTKSSKKPTDRNLALLLDMFRSPVKTAQTRGEECTRLFGRTVVVECVDHNNLNRSDLYHFSSRDFLVEVTDALASQFSNRLAEVVRWFATRGNPFQATQVAKKRLSKWSNKEICSIAVILQEPAEWILKELNKRKLLDWFMLAVMGSMTLTRYKKRAFVTGLLSHKLLLTVTAKSLVELTQILFQDIVSESAVASIVENHVEGHPFSEKNLIKLVQTMKGVSEILKTAEPTHHVEFPECYAGFYRRVASLDLLLAIETASQNDQPWLLRAFTQYQIPIEQRVPVSSAVGLIEVALKACLPDVAYRLTWRALSMTVSAETYLAVLEKWQLNEKYCHWLSEHHNGRSACEILATENPCVARRGDAILGSLLQYGPAATTYWRSNGDRPHSADLLRSCVKHCDQLRLVLAKTREGIASSRVHEGNTSNGNAPKNAKEKKKKKGKKKAKAKK